MKNVQVSLSTGFWAFAVDTYESRLKGLMSVEDFNDYGNIGYRLGYTNGQSSIIWAAINNE